MGSEDMDVTAAAHGASPIASRCREDELSNAARRVVRELRRDPYRMIYLSTDWQWRLERTGERVANNVVGELRNRRIINPVCTSERVGAYWISKTMDVEATMAHRRKIGHFREMIFTDGSVALHISRFSRSQGTSTRRASNGGQQ